MCLQTHILVVLFMCKYQTNTSTPGVDSVREKLKSHGRSRTVQTWDPSGKLVPYSIPMTLIYHSFNLHNKWSDCAWGFVICTGCWSFNSLPYVCWKLAYSCDCWRSLPVFYNVFIPFVVCVCLDGVSSMWNGTKTVHDQMAQFHPILTFYHIVKLL